MLLGPSGQNIYPEEIEDVLNNMPFVLESLVMQNTDNALVALVCPDMEAVDKAHLSNAQIREQMEVNRKQVNTQVAAYEQITQIRIFPHEFEKTPKKSIKRFLYNASMGE
jgi:long-chain acyl-CoA synthetase